MVLWRRPLIFVTDLAGGLGVAAITVTVVAMILLPVQRSLQTHDEMRAEASALHGRFERVAEQNRGLAERARALSETFQSLTDPRYADTAAFVEFVSTECKRLGLRLDEVQPQGAVQHADHRTWDVAMKSSGRFPELPGFLRRVESWSPFVHIRELTLTGPQRNSAAECQMNWTVRLISPTPGNQTAEERP